MATFFGKDPTGAVFQEFGPLHFFIIGLLAACIASTCLCAGRIRRHETLRRRLPVALGCVAWALLVAYNVWTYVNDLEFIKNLLPLELCSLSLLMTIPLAITGSHALFQVYYFFSAGALMAVLFPSFGGYGPTHIRFWHYFYTHSYIIWLNAYFLSVNRYALSRYAYAHLLAVVFPLAAIVRVIDMKFGVDYMFLDGPSATKSPLDFLGGGVGYFVKLMALVLGVFFVMYLAAPKDDADRVDKGSYNPTL
ncbi:MAG: TIGR02206 family membrane protein [Lachnospiraceae bacterium]|jgi:hypothetical integral membrane protein (TIGR02206 family)|nr:TIGR02206 family membrane protein [Lachnospiraceae bacterium]